MSIQVVGLKETLRDLNKLDPALRREIGRDIRRIVKPVADNVNQRIPEGAPLSGMDHQGRTGWNNRKPVVVKTDTRKPRYRIKLAATTKVSGAELRAALERHVGYAAATVSSTTATGAAYIEME